MIYDIVTYNGEKELFEIRYNLLKDYVDEFIVVEFDKTFSGKDKPYYFDLKWTRKNNIRYYVMGEKDYLKYKELAESSPNTQGAEHWKREFMQKESIKDCISHLEDNDICFIGDVDEIYTPFVLKDDLVYKLSQKMYTYYFNNRSSEEWYGTIVTRYKNIKNACLNHLRSHKDLYTKAENNGWHFSSLHHIMRRKLEDSYTADSYATPEVMANLEDNIANNKDFLGRPFVLGVDEVDLPKYLLDNREKYEHLFR